MIHLCRHLPVPCAPASSLLLIHLSRRPAFTRCAKSVSRLLRFFGTLRTNGSFTSCGTLINIGSLGYFVTIGRYDSLSRRTRYYLGIRLAPFYRITQTNRLALYSRHYLAEWLAPVLRYSSSVRLAHFLRHSSRKAARSLGTVRPGILTRSTSAVRFPSTARSILQVLSAVSARSLPSVRSAQSATRRATLEAPCNQRALRARSPTASAASPP